MCAKSRDFPEEPVGEPQDVDMSDAALEALLFGSSAGQTRAPGRTSVNDLEPGDPVRGVVIDTRGGEVLVEVDGKTHAVIEEGEFDEDDDLPMVGTSIEGRFIRYDKRRDLVVLGVREARRQFFLEELRPGTIVEGVVASTNRGGLTIDLRGHRAFLPISQIELSRVEDLEPYVGRKLACEVTSVDRDDRGTNIVLSRRAILEREAAELRGKALARLGEGEVLTGTITRVNEHGAFIDLGGVEGLLHVSKIRRHHHDLGRAEELQVGQQLEVEIVRVDREMGRIGLDFHRVAGADWGASIEGYEAGDEVTGWVSRVDTEGAWLSIDDGVEGLIPREHVDTRRGEIRTGNIVRARIASIDHGAKRIFLRPL